MYYSSNYSPISSSNLFHIPSPTPMQYEYEFFQYFQDRHLFQPQQLLTADHNLDTNMAEDSNKDTVISSSTNKFEENEKGCKNKKGGTSRTANTNKRATKKDRHSKINTAHGPRDRRMRLSLDVARKFFNLQDLLGFDKASKTVEWLLTKSKSAIKELEEGTSTTNIGAISASSTSECEVISGIIDESTTNDVQKKKPISSSSKENKKSKLARVRAAIFHPVDAKESRKQARARARERTKIKKSLHIGESINVCDDLKRLGSWSPFEESCIQDNTVMNHEKHDLLGSKENAVDDSNLVVATGNWSPYIFNYNHNTEISHEHQFTNFQFSGKLWEA